MEYLNNSCHCKVLQNLLEQRKTLNFVLKKTYIMKKLLLFSIILILTSCGKSHEEDSNGKSDEKNLNELIAKATKASLYIPESYDPVSTTCDSMRRPILSYTNIKKSAKIISLVREAEELQLYIDMDADIAELSRTLDGSSNNMYAKELTRNEAKKADLMAEASRLFTELSKDYFAPQDFYGYVVEHKFRAKNNMGNVVFGDILYILNKDKTEIEATFDTSDDDFVRFIQLIDAISEMGNNYSQEDLDLTDICKNIKSKFEL